MQRVTITPPVIQIALDYPTVEEAIAMARLGVEAGVDWLEVGTPLIVCQGIPAIGRLAKAFPDYPVLADYKTMDSGGKNVERTLEQGGHIMTVCANAPDETVKSAVALGRKTGILVIADTIGVKDQAARAGSARSGAWTSSTSTTEPTSAAPTSPATRPSGWTRSSPPSVSPSASAASASMTPSGRPARGRLRRYRPPAHQRPGPPRGTQTVRQGSPGELPAADELRRRIGRRSVMKPGGNHRGSQKERFPRQQDAF